MQISSAIEALRQVVTVDTSAVALREASAATFPHEGSASIIVRAKSLTDVVKSVEIANQFDVATYPISRGFNWGLGSRKPIKPGSLLLDLSEMNRIIEYDSELGCITVEPGVSFEQAAAFLKENGNRHFASVIGGPPQGSLIGNMLERGDGFGPLGNRAEHACDLEIVLGTGNVIRTGYGANPGSTLTSLDKSGVGPSLEGLFCQSNLGIVTRATIWLQRIPGNFVSFFYCLKDAAAAVNITTELQTLQATGVVRSGSQFLWNDMKAMAVVTQHPNPTGILNVESLLADYNPKLAGFKWFGGGALYAPTKQLAAAQQRAVRNALKSLCSRLTFFNRRTVRLARCANQIARLLKLPQPVDPAVLDGLYTNSVYLGNPTYRNIRSVYWRKKCRMPETIDPHRDRCGLDWVCHALPFTSDAVRETIDLCENIVNRYKLEPNLAFIMKSERCLNLAVQVTWDRDRKGEDERAEDCRTELAAKLNTAGYTAYRLGIQSMNLGPAIRPENSQFLQALKTICDPNQILATGRYDTLPQYG